MMNRNAIMMMGGGDMGPSGWLWSFQSEKIVKLSFFPFEVKLSPVLKPLSRLNWS